MNLQQVKESAGREFIDSITYNQSAEGCGIEDIGISDRYEAMEHGWNRAIEVVEENIDSLVIKAFTEGQDFGEKEVNKRAKKYITEVLGYTCPDFTI